MMLKGMKPEQFSEVLKFIDKNAKFAMFRGEGDFPNGPKNIKYIDSTFDTRFGDIWSVTFRGEYIRLATNHFAMHDMPEGFNYTNLYDWCMAYLKGEWIPTDEYKIERR